jgi:hypothetical protein
MGRRFGMAEMVLARIVRIYGDALMESIADEDPRGATHWVGMIVSAVAELGPMVNVSDEDERSRAWDDENGAGGKRG